MTDQDELGGMPDRLHARKFTLSGSTAITFVPEDDLPDIGQTYESKAMFTVTKITETEDENGARIHAVTLKLVKGGGVLANVD